MNLNEIINNLKLNGFVNAGQLVFSRDEIQELTNLSRRAFNNMCEQNQTVNSEGDFLDGSGGTRSFIARLPENNPQIANLLNKLVSDNNVCKILEEVLGKDYKIWQIVYRIARSGDRGLYLHQDGYGETNLCILLSNNKKGDGSTIFLPRSHFIKKTINQLRVYTPTKILRWLLFFFTPLTGIKGDISFFFNYTWHGRAPNSSNKNHEVILISFFPVGGAFGFDPKHYEYQNWSSNFLKNDTKLTRLINPKIGTKKLEDGRYEVVSKKEFIHKEPFVLKLHQGTTTSGNKKNFKLFFTLLFLRSLFIFGYPMRTLIKYLLKNR